MKEITKYVCEKCGTTYNTADDCLTCESTHLAPGEIIDVRYSRDNDYPIAICVQFGANSFWYSLG